MMIGLQHEPIDLAMAWQELADPRAGGIATFVGMVRNHNEGDSVEFLEYSTYEEMAKAQLDAIARDLRSLWPIEKLVLQHRVGRLDVGEIAVFVGVACAHRQDAFAACRYGIEKIKHDLAIWKREVFVGGQRWVAGCAHHEHEGVMQYQ